MTAVQEFNVEDKDVNHPLRSVATANLGEMLAQLKISLVVSTYQAGKVILVRPEPGMVNNRPAMVVNTHFRNFEKPMGLAVTGNLLTIGGQKSVTYLHNMPAVARKLEPHGRYDSCYLLRSVHITGDIDIHEMAYDAHNELWLVNTRFSCLCTLDHAHSFTPRSAATLCHQLCPGRSLSSQRPGYGEWPAKICNGIG